MSVCWGFPGGSVVKNLLANAEEIGLTFGSGRSPGEANGNPLQYSCLENPMDRGARQATVHEIAKTQIQLSDKTHTHTHRIQNVHSRNTEEKKDRPFQFCYRK